jgi:anti-sigma regulatory factor (Ser/Thr protein kinase)
VTAGGAGLRELSLHILDIVENSIKAGASEVWVSISEKPELDKIEITVDDNGKGLEVVRDVATDPFYTTKTGKRTGLGLSLFKSGVERADGTLSLERSVLGGLCVSATMRISHVDRSPLGDLAGTLSSVVVTNPHLKLRCRLRVREQEIEVVPSELNPKSSITLAAAVNEEIKRGIRMLNVIQ